MRPAHQLFRFGPFELDTHRHELRRKGHPVAISGATMELLLFLLASRGGLVTRQEIVRALWTQPESVDVVQGVNTAIARLRAVLRDQASSPRFVQTVVGRGYRFIAPVEVQPIDEPEAVPEEPGAAHPARLEGSAGMAPAVAEPVSLEAGHTLDPEPPPWAVLPTPRPGASRRISLEAKWATLAVAVVLLVTAIFVERRMAGARQAVRRIDSVAVLPVVNLSGDPREEYLADGITDEIIGDLVQSGHIRVVSRTSVMQFKGASRPVQEIGRKLGVDAVVESSLSREANHFRMTVRLVAARDDRSLWARTFNESGGTINGLATRASEELLNQLHTNPDGRSVEVPAKRYVPQGKAYDLYLLGRYASQKHTPEGVARTIQLYKQTIEEDPHFAQAYASLAGNYIEAMNFEMIPQGEALSLAEKAALKAVQLDNQLPGAHSSMALVLAYRHADWAGAVAEDRLAIRLEDEARFHANLGTLLAQMGRSEEALKENNLALAMEPTSLAINAQLAESLYFVRRYDDAIQQAQTTLTMQPDFYEAAETLAKALHQKAKDREAIEVMKRSAGPILQMNFPRALLAALYAGSRQRAAAGELTKALKASEAAGASAYCDVAIAEAAQGDTSHAAQQIGEAYERHEANLLYLNDPLFDPLRGNAEFLQVERRLALR